MSRLTTAAEIAKIVESCAAIIALGAGAWWFFAQRETYPRAQIHQSATIVSLGQNKVAVEVQAEFENTGKKLIRLTAANVRLQSVESEPYAIAKLADSPVGEYWNAKRALNTPNPEHFVEGELRWPVIRQFVGPINHAVEPGETDLSIFTFIVNCSDPFKRRSGTLHDLRIATDMFKPEDPNEPDFAWKARTFVNVSAACLGMTK